MIIEEIKVLLKNEEGAETTEYVAIVAVVIVLGTIAYSNNFVPIVSTAMSALISAAYSALGLD